MKQKQHFEPVIALVLFAAIFTVAVGTSSYGFATPLGLPTNSGFNLGDLGSTSSSCPKQFEFSESSDYTYTNGTIDFVTSDGKTIAKPHDVEAATESAPTMVTKKPIQFTELTGFTAQFTTLGNLHSSTPGQARFRLSTDNVKWYFYNTFSNTWLQAFENNITETNSASDINSHLDSFNELFSGRLYIKIYLITDSMRDAQNTLYSSYPKLDWVRVECLPTASVIDTSGISFDADGVTDLLNGAADDVSIAADEDSGSADEAGADVAVDDLLGANLGDAVSDEAAQESPSDDGATDSFVDVPESNPHAKAIEVLRSKNIVSGFDSQHFGPTVKLRRGELLKIALNGAGIDTAEYAHAENPYSDLSSDHSLKQYILYAYHAGIATGYGDGTFGADNVATHAEAVKMLLNVNGIQPVTPPAGISYDLPKESDLGGYIHAAMQMNLLYDPANFGVKSPILRDYTAEIMYRILQVHERGLSSYSEE